MRRQTFLGEGATLAKIKFGAVINRHFRSWKDVITFAERAEALGYDSLWAPEHSISHIPEVDPFVVLTVAALKTRRIQLGTCVLRVPLRNPVILARALVSLDTLCSGRLTVGIGVGGENAGEFEGAGVPLKQRGSRTDEAIQVMKRLWAGNPAAFQGKYFRLEGVVMQPKPAQPGGPAIWVGGRGDAAMRRAARLGDGFMPYFYTPERYREGLVTIRKYASECGRGPDAVYPAYLQYCCLGKPAEAEAWARAHLGRNYNLNPDQVDRYSLNGPAAKVIEGVQLFIAAGARHIVIDPACPSEEQLHQLEAFASEVIPHLGS